MANRERKPLGFGGTMLASALGVIIAGAVGCIIMIIFTLAMVVGIAAASSNNGDVDVEDGTFLKIDLQKIAGERAPSQRAQLFSNKGAINSLNESVAAILAAKDDDDVKGIYLVNSATATMAWGSAEELRNALKEFKDSGKPILAYGDSYSQTGYYLSSLADKICVHPSGMIDYRGIGSQVIYYKDLLDKLGVQMQLIRPASCSYKSAGETYTMNKMSSYNREQIHVYINSIWGHVVNELSQARGISVDKLNLLADDLLAYLPQDALQQGMVDTLCFFHDTKVILKEHYKAKHLMPLHEYVAHYKNNLPAHKDKIAVIYAEGNVVDGNGNSTVTAVYGNQIAKALDDARKAKDVKAIVLRVNSPGGMVTASETMTAAVMRAKAKKPVIVSMSDLAASAGYEISCNATKIVAQPTTITGSIGVFATIPNVGGALKNKLGISIDTAMTNKNAVGINGTQALSHTALAMLTRNVEDFYVTFTERVAKGRGLDVKYIDSIARGRVWTGADALKLGLVDTLGGMQVALQLAACEAGINDYSIREYPKQKDLWSDLMDLYGNGGNDDNTLDVLAGETYRPGILAKARLAWQYHALKKDAARGKMDLLLSRIQQDMLYISHTEGLQARLPFIVVEE